MIRAQVFTQYAVRDNEAFLNTLLPTADVARIVDHPARKYLLRYMCLPGGGFYVFGGPSSVGKSTMLFCAIDQFRSKDSKRRVAFLTSKTALTGRGIHKALGVPDQQRISSYCSPGAVVVVDQFDVSAAEMTTEIESYMKELAVDSVNSSKFKVIVVVSDPEVMKKILLLNDREKIEDVMNPVLLKWNYTQINFFIEDNFEDWSAADQAVLADAAMISFSPGGLRRAIRSKAIYGDLTPISPAQTIDEVKAYSRIKLQSWQRFERELEGLQLKDVVLFDTDA